MFCLIIYNEGLYQINIWKFDYNLLLNLDEGNTLQIYYIEFINVQQGGKLCVI